MSGAALRVLGCGPEPSLEVWPAAQAGDQCVSRARAGGRWGGRSSEQTPCPGPASRSHRPCAQGGGAALAPTCCPPGPRLCPGFRPSSPRHLGLQGRLCPCLGRAGSLGAGQQGQVGGVWEGEGDIHRPKGAGGVVEGAAQWRGGGSVGPGLRPRQGTLAPEPNTGPLARPRVCRPLVQEAPSGGQGSSGHMSCVPGPEGLESLCQGYGCRTPQQGARVVGNALPWTPRTIVRVHQRDPPPCAPCTRVQTGPSLCHGRGPRRPWKGAQDRCLLLCGAFIESPGRPASPVTPPDPQGPGRRGCRAHGAVRWAWPRGRDRGHEAVSFRAGVARREAGSLAPGLGGSPVARVELPDKVLLVDLPHLVPRDLLHQQEFRGHRIRGQDTSAETGQA